MLELSVCTVFPRANFMRWTIRRWMFQLTRWPMIRTWVRIPCTFALSSSDDGCISGLREMATRYSFKSTHTRQDRVLSNITETCSEITDTFDSQGSEHINYVLKESAPRTPSRQLIWGSLKCPLSHRQHSAHSRRRGQTASCQMTSPLCQQTPTTLSVRPGAGSSHSARLAPRATINDHTVVMWACYHDALSFMDAGLVNGMTNIALFHDIMR